MANIPDRAYLHEPLFRELHRYVDFSPNDQHALQALHPVLQPHFDDIIERFYARLYAHEHARRVFIDEAQMDRLRVTLNVWLNRLLSGPWDEQYWADRYRIGVVHVRVALPQRYMFTAMDVVRCRMIELIFAHYDTDATQRMLAVRAIGKILDMELAIMLESFSESNLARVQKLERQEKDQLSQQLALSEARYTAIVDNAAAMVLVVDHDGKIVLFNRKAEEVSGWSRREVVGKACIDKLCESDYHTVARAALTNAATGQRVLPFEAAMKSSTGVLRWVRWHATQLPGEAETLACLIGVDVTEERALEMRTRRAERLASLGTLAAGLAHEIRNPLNAASLQLKLVTRRLGKSQEQGVQSALKAARVVDCELERLAGLVQDFLAFARPAPLRRTKGDLGESVATVMSLMQAEAEAARVTLVRDPGDEPLEATYDSERLKQVVLNLLRNAIEAAGKSGEVRVQLKHHGDMAMLTISDTGSGVPANMEVFEPFATSKDTGTGLGLPIVHRIVTDHGGDIQWHRDNGRTVFVVELPLGPTA